MNQRPHQRAFDDIDAIVVGASAGGVEALMTLVAALPRGLAAAVVVVLHLPRQHPSSLIEIFSPRCALPVVEAEDKLAVVGGTVYVAPPDYHVLIDRGPTLALSSDEPVNYSRPSIDVLFESAADAYGARVAGVILTGANADGAAGLDAIRRAGGITVVQDPATAVASAMPTAAMERGTVDHALSLERIAVLFRGLPTR